MTLLSTLSPEHYEEILVGSAINPDVAAARGYRTLFGEHDAAELEALGFSASQVQRPDAYPLLLVPMKDASGTVKGHQIKPAAPRHVTAPGKLPRALKYETPKGAPNMVDVPDFTRGLLTDLAVPLWITEGMKKVDALVSHGLGALGLTGVYNWRDRLGTLGDWEDIPLKGRTIVLCFDADAVTNRNVQQAMARLGGWCKSKGAREVKYIVVPPMVGDTPVKGVDDFFAAGGTVETLAAVATESAPGSTGKDAGFTDALLVERAVEEALTGRFRWAKGLGWLQWDGRVWIEVSDVEPLEAVRQWAAGHFEAACMAQAKNAADASHTAKVAGWRGVLAKAKLTALRDLARGVDGVLTQSAAFDGDPDLLTCTNGTVDLRTGELRPHSPADMITKMADAAYTFAATHPLFIRAMQALPSHLHEWYQDRMGQAITGYSTPDHKLVISQGSGSNGKSTLADIFRRTTGSYGVLVSERALLANSDAHPTELMDFRGARYAVMEETPEARHLNVQRLKSTIGTPTMKARHMRQDTVEFLTTHSLFINTNYTPVVVETDHGTWRRLALLPFPYTFRPAGKPLRDENDREGDPALVYAANNAGVRAAALAWMVAGAVKWYRRDRMMLPVPDAIEDATRAWRTQTDLIMGFADDCLKPVTDGFVSAPDMLGAFNAWSAEHGHKPWNDRTLAARMSAHETISGWGVKQGRKRIDGKQLRGWTHIALRGGDDPWGNRPEPEAEPPAPEPDPQDWIDPQGDAPGGTPETSSSGAVVGFDLETADAKTLFTGGHRGPFVRLAGLAHPDPNVGNVIPQTHTLIQDLNAAETIYGHNILGFDLLALAHHHGADYDRLAEKSIDTLVLARLIDPPMSKGMPNGYYMLDAVAERLGVAGKTDDLKRLADKHGGYDMIPLDDPEYAEYLRGDLAASKEVYKKITEELPLHVSVYARREMRIVALQNRMTLNGWRVAEDVLAERVAAEDAKRAAAVAELRERYGVPTHRPDRFKLKLKKDWPQQWSMADVKALDGEMQEREGFAVRIPGEEYDAPWATALGREAIIEAFADAGMQGYPTTAKGVLALGKDALGDGEWYCPIRRQSYPGVLSKYGHVPQVRSLVETILQATGARMKYAEIAKYATDRGRVHAWIGAAQGSGRWAMTQPSITNMGMRGEAAEERAVLIADEGETLVTVDLSQVDMRAVAGLSQDTEYMKLFEPGRDAHMDMAEVYFGERTKEARNRTKAINHGLNYGESPRRVAQANGLDEDVVYAAVRARAEAYPRVIEWTDEVRAEAAAGQLLDNGFGRKMRANPERAHTQAPALCGQGAARDIMCESLLRLVDLADGEGLNVRPHLRGVVHDELILSVPDAEVETWQRLLKAAFTWEWRGVPILCDLGEPAKKWVDCK